MPFSWSVGVSPTMTMSKTSSVARCCVLLWIFHKNNIFLFQGLASHIDKFVEEEVEVRHIPQLSDVDLRSLGFLTIGSRQQIRSAATSWVPQVICLCSFDSHVLKKVLYKYNDMFFFSREIWYKKSLVYVSIFTTQLAGTEFSRRRLRGKWRERDIVNCFGACELVWCLEIICIFSHESIEKSLPHNLQEPYSRGEDIAEDGEREVLCIDLVFVNWFDF